MPEYFMGTISLFLTQRFSFLFVPYFSYYCLSGDLFSFEKQFEKSLPRVFLLFFSTLSVSFPFHFPAMQRRKINIYGMAVGEVSAKEIKSKEEVSLLLSCPGSCSINRRLAINKYYKTKKYTHYVTFIFWQKTISIISMFYHQWGFYCLYRG